MSMESDGREVPLYCWKFQIPSNDPRVIETYPNGSTVSMSGCSAGAIAATEEEARAILVRDGEEHGNDTRWLAVATVRRTAIDMPKPLWWVVF